MIKNIRIFPNNNKKSIDGAVLIKDKLLNHGFRISDDNFDLGIAIGGDGSFLRMVKQCDFNSDVYYVGINFGTLGYLQEVKKDDLDKFIEELKQEKFKVENIGIQETTVVHAKQISKFYSFNDIVVRKSDLRVAHLDVFKDNYFLENYVGDGILICTAAGSTGYNASLGGSIIDPVFTCLEMTPIAPINSSEFHTLDKPLIVPDQKIIKIVPKTSEGTLIQIDGVNHEFSDVDSIETVIRDKKIKCLRLSHYNFPQKINEKLLK